MRGEIVDMVLFDVGAEVDLPRVRSMLGQVPLPAPLVSRLPAPPSLTLPAPIKVEVPAAMHGGQAIGARVEVRLYAVGVLAVRVRVPFDEPTLNRLPNAASAVRIGGGTPRHAARKLLEAALTDIRPALREPYDVAVEPETYTAYALHGETTAQVLLRDHAKALAGILLGERDWADLAPPMVEDALQRRLQYQSRDLVAVGWDNAVVVFPNDEYDDVLDVLELANLELLELRTLDAFLDARIDTSMVEVERLWARGGLFRSARGVLEELGNLRADFVRLRDAIHDQGKIYGDWYLAKVHQRLRDRFHLAEWEQAVEAKMGALGAMFQLAGEEANHRRALVLESMIVLLFIIDLAAIFLLK